jgi:tetratricopeptide (TPR) repeat protein
MNMRSVFRSLLLGLSCFVSVSSYAETASDYDTCRNEEVSIADRIGACTRIANDNAPSPNQNEAYRNRGSAYLDREQYDLAIADETKAIGLNAQDAHAYNLRAWAYLKSGDAKKALADVNVSLSLNPQLADAFDTRGRTYEAMGMKNEAIGDYRKALSIDPKHTESKDSLDRLGIALTQ